MSLCLWVWWLVTVGTLTLTWLPTELLDIRVENPFFNTASQVTGQGPWPVRWCGQMCRVPWTFFLPGADMQSTKISSATDVWSSKMVNTSISSSQPQEEWATVLLRVNFNSIGIEDELKLKHCKGHLQTCRPWICSSVNQTGHWRIIHIPLQSSTSSTFTFSFISWPKLDRTMFELRRYKNIKTTSKWPQALPKHPQPPWQDFCSLLAGRKKHEVPLNGCKARGYVPLCSTSLSHDQP